MAKQKTSKSGLSGYRLVYDKNGNPKSAVTPSGKSISYREYRNRLIAKTYPELKEKTPEGLARHRTLLKRRSARRLEKLANFQAQGEDFLRSIEGKSKAKVKNQISKIENKFSKKQAEELNRKIVRASEEVIKQRTDSGQMGGGGGGGRGSSSQAYEEAWERITDEWHGAKLGELENDPVYKIANEVLSEPHSGSEMDRNRFEALQLLGYISDEYTWQEWKEEYGVY